MVTDVPFPRSKADAKAQALTLRLEAARAGTRLRHSEALERVAQAHGLRDWNTLAAQLNDGAATARYRTGDRVSGVYLRQSFNGEVLAVRDLAPGRTHLTIHFDAPVDVVRFSSFSALRQRITCVVDEAGRTPSRLSDGTPHVILDG